MTPAYKIVHDACVAAVPEIVERKRQIDIYDQNDAWSGIEEISEERKIHLADVLLAMDGKHIFHVYAGGQIWIDDRYTMIKWNLRNDSLDWHAEHKPETIAFLADLLGNK